MNLPTLHLSAFLTLIAVACLANPIAVDSTLRPCTMLSEEVAIDVHPHISEVAGTYTFRQEEDDWPEIRDTHVQIIVPVLIPPDGLAAYISEHGAPSVAIRGVRFVTRINEDISSSDALPAVRLPGKWTLAMFQCDVPLRLVSSQFTIHVAYIQPHFGDNSVGYVPVRPPRNLKASKIVFVAAASQPLRLVNPFSFRTPSRDLIQAIPKDQKLIRVRSYPHKS